MPITTDEFTTEETNEILRELVTKRTTLEEFMKGFRSCEDPDTNRVFKEEWLQYDVSEPERKSMDPMAEAIRVGILSHSEHIRNVEPTRENALELWKLISRGMEIDHHRLSIRVRLNFVGEPYLEYTWDGVDFFGGSVP